MRFEVEIKNGIKYTIRHMAGGDLVEIKIPYRAKPVKGFVRKAMTDAPVMRRSA